MPKTQLKKLVVLFTPIIRKGIRNRNFDHPYSFLIAETGYMKLVFWNMYPLQKKPESKNHPDNPDLTDMTKYIRIFRLNTDIPV